MGPRILAPAVGLALAVAMVAVAPVQSAPGTASESSYLYAIDGAPLRVIPWKGALGRVVIDDPNVTQFTDMPARQAAEVTADEFLEAYGQDPGSWRLLAKAPNAAVAVDGGPSQIVEIRRGRVVNGNLVLFVTALDGKLNSARGPGNVFVDNAPAPPCKSASGTLDVVLNNTTYGTASYSSPCGPNAHDAITVTVPPIEVRWGSGIFSRSCLTSTSTTVTVSPSNPSASQTQTASGSRGPLFSCSLTGAATEKTTVTSTWFTTTYDGGVQLTYPQTLKVTFAFYSGSSFVFGPAYGVKTFSMADVLVAAPPAPSTSPTPNAAPTPSATPSPSVTATPTPSATPSPSVTATPTPSATPSPSVTASPSAS